MRIIEAKHSGACYGVKRALAMADETIESGLSACTLGSIIHNPLVVESLRRRGLCAVGKPEEIETPVVIIRSHGVTPQVRRRLVEQGRQIVDATCPHVLLAQRAAAKLAQDIGYVIIVGEAGHPEVVALSAYASESGARVAICSCGAEVSECLPPQVGVVVQTTQTAAVRDDVIAAIRAKGSEVVLRDTICQATQERQNTAMDVAAHVDAMVVIGGLVSANTLHLAAICQAVCPRTYHVESAEDIDPAWFTSEMTVGVTAGASTPQSQIQDIVLYLRNL